MRSLILVLSLFLCACGAASEDVEAPSDTAPIGSDTEQVEDSTPSSPDSESPADGEDSSAANPTTEVTDTEDDTTPDSDEPESGADTTETTPPDDDAPNPPADGVDEEDSGGGAIEEGTDVPPAPTDRQANATWQVTVTQLVEGQYTYAWDPDGNQLVLQDAEGATMLATGGFIPDDVTGDPGTITGAARVSVGGSPVALVAGSGGLHVLQDQTLSPSPLGDLLGGALIEELLGQPAQGEGDDWLWLAAAEDLWLFRDGELFALTEPSLTLGSSNLVFGPPVGGIPALWGSGPEGIWGLLVESETITLAATRSDINAEDMTADAGRHIWVVDDIGDLHERQPSGDWVWWRCAGPVTKVEGAQATAGLWLVVGDEIWFWQDHQLGPLETALTGTLLGVDTKGRAMIGNEQGIYAVAIDGVGEVVVEEPPTWSEDIQPLNEAHCSECHGEGAFAHPMFEMQTWIDEYDLIISMVAEPPGNPQMPLPPNPPLDNAAISAIIQWQEAGFPE